jgi:hypothetical protein
MWRFRLVKYSARLSLFCFTPPVVQGFKKNVPYASAPKPAQLRAQRTGFNSFFNPPQRAAVGCNSSRCNGLHRLEHFHDSVHFATRQCPR